VPIPCSKIN
ncbi:IMV membrane protein A21, partial [Monkeypox virus]